MGGGLNKLPAGTQCPCHLSVPLELQAVLHSGSRKLLFLTPQDIDLRNEVNKDGAHHLRKVPVPSSLSPLSLVLALSLLYKASSKRGTPRLCSPRKQNTPIMDTKNPICTFEAVRFKHHAENKSKQTNLAENSLTCTFLGVGRSVFGNLA